MCRFLHVVHEHFGFMHMFQDASESKHSLKPPVSIPMIPLARKQSLKNHQEVLREQDVSVLSARGEPSVVRGLDEKNEP